MHSYRVLGLIVTILLALILLFATVFSVHSPAYANDLTIRCPDGHSLTREDFSISLPESFPDTIFSEWMFYLYCAIEYEYILDINKDGGNDTYAVESQNFEGEHGILFFKILSETSIMAFAFIESVNGRAELSWVDEGVPTEVREFLQKVINGINEESQV